ncbi:HEAT repeat domain-containing protein [Pseudobacteriovorax antillogorgiicola]|uniref:HEAT repeat-containing protein n=1 Tax=Pseudobacteriovorax antillogorgiicola TaxID=1513793 RepID=A0A1Y6CQE4_9BACT|nr:HEAT repeat domain-containing protein [Pseudobacteriovorax antillogorgiicola]TCS42867.1 HEAT repeat protein [Pseudobacteriovorax antillogorgiicola]SMF82043.1 HEAT repeat-containing protein [Pseudobacteriovorax antillogorgiicola]
MLKKVLGLLAVLVLTLGFLSSLKERPEVQSPEADLTTSSQVFRITTSPGDELQYHARFETTVSIGSVKLEALEALKLEADLVIRYYQQDSRGMLAGMRLKNMEIQAPKAMALDTNLENLEILYFDQVGGIEEFYVSKDMAPWLSSLLRGAAAAVQVSLPQESQLTVGATWSGSEPSPNGPIALRMSSTVNNDRLSLVKSYLHVAGDPSLVVQKDSQGLFSYHRDGFLIGLDHQLAIRKYDEGSSVLGAQQIQLTFQQRRRGLDLFNPLANRLSKMNAVAADEPLEANKEMTTVRMKQALSGLTQEQLLEKIVSLQGFDDQNIGVVLIQLEAMLHLNPQFKNVLWDQLQLAQSTTEYDWQLSLIMGAFASMDAVDIEDELIFYSESNRHAPDVVQQTAFALSDLKKPSVAVRNHLMDLSQSNDSEIRTMGILSLGALARHKEHNDLVLSHLRAQLRDANDDDKLIFLAAINNSHSQENLSTLSRYFDSSDEVLAAQAVYGLKHVASKDALPLLAKTLRTESREAVLLQALQALGAHVHDPRTYDLVRMIVDGDYGAQVKVEALNVVAGMIPYKPEVRGYLETIKGSHSYLQRIRSYAGDILLSSTPS